VCKNACKYTYTQRNSIGLGFQTLEFVYKPHADCAYLYNTPGLVLQSSKRLDNQGLANSIPDVDYRFTASSIRPGGLYCLFCLLFDEPLNSFPGGKIVRHVQGGSNMTGTNCDLFTHK
jgi:hypothetical protein